MRVELELISKEIPESARLGVHEESEDIRRLSDFIEQEQFKNRILLCYKDKEQYQVDYRDIYYIESVQEVQYIHTREEIYCTRRRLYELQKMLPEEFVRASKSVLLNRNMVFHYKPAGGGVMQAELKNKEQVYISRKYLKEIRAKMKEGAL